MRVQTGVLEIRVVQYLLQFRILVRKKDAAATRGLD